MKEIFTTTTDHVEILPRIIFAALAWFSAFFLGFIVCEDDDTEKKVKWLLFLISIFFVYITSTIANYK